MTCFDEENFVITDSNIEKCKDVENIANVEMQNSVSLLGLFG